MRDARAEIDLDAIRRNLARVRDRASGAKVLAVVKADGYGHGLERVARALLDTDAFGVASIDDAERLRALGLRHRIVLLSGFDAAADLPLIRALELDAVLHDEAQQRILERDRGPPLRLWIKLDTGMGRLGFPAEQAPALARWLGGRPNIAPDWVWMTHFASADLLERDTTRRQMDRFTAALGALPGARSLANSAGIVAWPESHADWVRPGGVLYGLSSIPGRTGTELGFEPAMRVSSSLIAIKTVPAGQAVGYGETYRCAVPTRLGVVAFGYGDGYPRHADSGTPVWVRGRVVPIVGRVSMDLVTVDLGAVPEAQVGDSVVLWGPELPAERIATSAATIAYELTCGVTRRVRFVEARRGLERDLQRVG